MKKFLTALFALAITLSFSGPANASPSLAAHVGPAGYFSAWDGCPVGYCGAAWAFPVNRIGLCQEVPLGSNDRWTAVDNNFNRNVKIYQGTGCTGNTWTIFVGTFTGVLGSGANNVVTSYRIQ